MSKKKELEKVIENIKKENFEYARNKVIKWIVRDFITKGIPIGLVIGFVAIIPFYLFNYKITQMNYIEILSFSALFYAILRVIFLETKEEQIVSLTLSIEKAKGKGEELNEKTIEKLALYKIINEGFRNLYLISFTFLIDLALLKFLLLK